MTDRRKFLASSGKVAVAAASFSLVRSASAEEFPSKDLGENISLGLHLHEVENFGNMAEMARPDLLRLWDSKTCWVHLQPDQNVWNFARLDRYVAQARAKNVAILYTLGQTPRWAAADKNVVGVYGLGATSPPADMAFWRTYVRTLVTRYKGIIRYWELWNEVNSSNFYSGDLAHLVEMARIAREEIKAQDPSASLLSPSIQGGAFTEFGQLCASGVMAYCDAVSYHFYAPKNNPEEAYRRTLRVRQILESSGFSKMPLWNTEVGWLVDDPEIPASLLKPAWASGWLSVNPRDLGRFLVRSAILNKAAGVNALIWYGWDNRVMGLGGFGGRMGSKKAVAAYRRSKNILAGYKVASVTFDGVVWRIMGYKNGAESQIVWTEGSRQMISFPAGWKASAYYGDDGTDCDDVGLKVVACGMPKMLVKGGV